MVRIWVCGWQASTFWTDHCQGRQLFGALLSQGPNEAPFVGKCWRKPQGKHQEKPWKLCQHFPDGFMAQKWMFSCAVFAVEKSTFSDVFNSNFQYSTSKDSNIF